LGSCEYGNETSGFTKKKKLTISPLTEELLASQEELCYVRSVRKMYCGRLLGTSKRKFQNVKVDCTEIPWGNVA